MEETNYAKAVMKKVIELCELNQTKGLGDWLDAANARGELGDVGHLDLHLYLGNEETTQFAQELLDSAPRCPSKEFALATIYRALCKLQVACHNLKVSVPWYSDMCFQKGAAFWIDAKRDLNEIYDGLCIIRQEVVAGWVQDCLRSDARTSIRPLNDVRIAPPMVKAFIDQNHTVFVNLAALFFFNAPSPTFEIRYVVQQAKLS